MSRKLWNGALCTALHVVCQGVQASGAFFVEFCCYLRTRVHQPPSPRSFDSHRRLQRDDIPVCNCVAPLGAALSSRRAGLEQQPAPQRQQLAVQQAQWQPPPLPPAPQQQQVAAPALAAAALPLPPPPLPLPPAPATQHVVHRPRQPLACEDCDPASPDDAGGSAKKRVRRTDWEGRKCAWCGVTETSNWRRHPEDRDMLLCNQVRCGGGGGAGRGSC